MKIYIRNMINESISPLERSQALFLGAYVTIKCVDKYGFRLEKLLHVDEGRVELGASGSQDDEPHCHHHQEPPSRRCPPHFPLLFFFFFYFYYFDPFSSSTFAASLLRRPKKARRRESEFFQAKMPTSFQFLRRIILFSARAAAFQSSPFSSEKSEKQKERD